MDTFVLRPDVRERLESDPELREQDVNDTINDALDRFLEERQLAKIEREADAYRVMHPDLKQKYLGHWVAIHNQQLVDHDEDGVALHRRIRDKYGLTAVLIKQVEESPERDLWFRSFHWVDEQ